ncbi:MAG: hypothetical protein ABR577_09610 [Pyrinomonadaceae bacterium]
MKPLVTCEKCGAELMAEARYCRRCGRPSPLLDAASVTEHTTRLLDMPADYGALQPRLNTEPIAYQPPDTTQAVANTTTRTLERRRQSPRSWRLTALLMLIAIAFVSLIVINKERRQIRIISRPPRATVPELPPLPDLPPPPSFTARTGDALAYPGARITMNVTRSGKGSVLQMRTEDSPDEVAEWYTEKLNPTKVVKMPGLPIVLEAAGSRVIITPAGDGADIVIKRDS